MSHLKKKCKVYEIVSCDTFAYASLGNCVKLVYEIRSHFMFFYKQKYEIVSHIMKCDANSY